MDGLLYYGTLLILAILAFTLNQNHNSKLAILVVLIGVYIVYSHETGNTATQYKNEMVESLNESAEDFAKIHKTEGFDETKALKELE